MAGYPKIYNIEMDPHQAAMFGWVSGPALKTVDEYMAIQIRPRRALDPFVARSCRLVGSASTSAVSTFRTWPIQLTMSADRVPGKADVATSSRNFCRTHFGHRPDDRLRPSQNVPPFITLL
jgi:hypothetical protein